MGKGRPDGEDGTREQRGDGAVAVGWGAGPPDSGALPRALGGFVACRVLRVACCVSRGCGTERLWAVGGRETGAWQECRCGEG